MERTRKTRPAKDGHEIRAGRVQNTPKQPHKETRQLRKICGPASQILQMRSASQRRSRNRKASAMRSNNANDISSMRQRVAVRITYTQPKSPGHWKQHGSYIQREAAAGKSGAGFSSGMSGIDIPEILNQWQVSADPRIWRVIISPEEGNLLSMREYTESVMKRVEKETGFSLEWVAAEHTNTDNPHVHVVIRGIAKDGKEVFFDKDFVQNGFRTTAQEAATDRLGYRTKEQLEAALMREVIQDRFTSLDRAILKAAMPGLQPGVLRITVNSPAFVNSTRNDPARIFALERRLYHLQDLGLAKPDSFKSWTLPIDYDRTLRNLQIAGDKQKMLGRSMVPASSTDQPILSMRWNQIDTMHARILGHGEDEVTSKRFLMIETINGNIIYLQHRADSETLRNRGLLNRNHFVTFTRSKRGALQVEDHGQAVAALEDRDLMVRLVREQPAGSGRPGWLGSLDAAMELAATGSYIKPETHTAFRLSREDVALLFNGAYARHTHNSDTAFRHIHGEPGYAKLKDQSIEIRFSEKTQNYYAFVTRSEKARLTNSLSDLAYKKQRADLRAQERAHERG